MLTLLLWGEAFDAEFAVSVLCALRRAQIVTKLVGIHGRMAVGAHGIGIYCDLTLGQAMPLARTADVVIVPCHSPHLRAVELDPRVAHLLSVGHDHGARLITGAIAPTDANLFPCPLHHLEMWLDPRGYRQALDALIRSLNTTLLISQQR